MLEIINDKQFAPRAPRSNWDIVPLKDLKVGQSILLPAGFGKVATVCTNAYHRAYKLGFKVSTRSTPEGVYIIRVS